MFRFIEVDKCHDDRQCASVVERADRSLNRRNENKSDEGKRDSPLRFMSIASHLPRAQRCRSPRRTCILQLSSIGINTFAMKFMNVTLEAVAMLQRNEHSKAAYLLRQGLKALRDEEIQRNQTTENSRRGSRTKFDGCIIAIPLTSSSPSTTKQSLRENVFSFFDRALSVGRADADADLVSSNDQERAVFAATILYNMGLCHHHKGIVMNGNPKHLERALHYYQMAYETINDDTPITDATALILLALANNMGHLFAHALDHTSMSLCHESFVCLISSISMDISVLNDSDRHFFSFSGRCLLTMQLNAAPAA